MTNPKINYITSDSYITGIQTIASTSQITNTRQSLTSDSFIEDPKTTILCDGQIITEIIDEFGTSIILRVRAKTVPDSDDPYATFSVSNTDYKKTALVQRYTASDDEVKEGTFKAGEVVFVFSEADEDHVREGNRILYAGNWFEISDITKHPMQDALYRLEARVRKI
jgi:hypothetical protein